MTGFWFYEERTPVGWMKIKSYSQPTEKRAETKRQIRNVTYIEQQDPMITDENGEVPTYVIVDGELWHQPSGHKVPLPANHTMDQLREALVHLENKVDSDV